MLMHGKPCLIPILKYCMQREKRKKNLTLTTKQFGILLQYLTKPYNNDIVKLTLLWTTGHSRLMRAFYMSEVPDSYIHLHAIEVQSIKPKIKKKIGSDEMANRTCGFRHFDVFWVLNFNRLCCIVDYSMGCVCATQAVVEDLKTANTYEPRHGKTCFCYMRTTKPPISRGSACTSAQSDQRLCCSVPG